MPENKRRTADTYVRTVLLHYCSLVIVIGVPVRYAHTHYGISAYADFDNAVKLACEILKRLDEEQIMSF